MDEFLKYLLAGCAGGGVGGGGIGAFLFFLLKRHLARRDALEAKLEAEKEKKFDALERKIDNHLEEDNPGKVEERLNKLAGEVTRLGDAATHNQERMQSELREVAKTLGKIDGTLGGIDTWLRNINQSVQEHVTDGRIHHHGTR